MKRIFVILTNPEYGRYTAFDPDQPEVKATASCLNEAIGNLIRENQAHFGVQISDIEED